MFCFKTIAVWLLIIIAESVHGTLRQLFLAPRVGDLNARRIGFFVGIAIIFAIAYFSVNWLRAWSRGALFAAGTIWMILTFVFEIVLGRFVMGLEWDRVAEDYDPTRGGLMAFGLIFLLFAPFLASVVRKKQ